MYHIGVPINKIKELAKKSVNMIPCMMPHITSFFMPRTTTDRPKPIVDGATNFAFIGQFVEEPRECVFTVEGSVRTAMVAVYSLLNIDRGVPEVFNSCYDVRILMSALYEMTDKQKLIEGNILPF
jgi:oleate hydratase